MTRTSRTTFTTSRMLDFFTKSELTRQIGYPIDQWATVLIKELIDNALDACESINTPPEITVTLEDDAFTVSDNGSGLASDIINSSLDYSIRISDKKHYVSPTRGQLGNALKCVWAAAFVATGKGIVEVTARGLCHRIEVSADPIRQEPRIVHTTSPSVKIGTSVRVLWAGLQDRESDGFYQGAIKDAIPHMLAEFSAFNPHANFTFNCLGESTTLKASNPEWMKWRASESTSALWYTTDTLSSLIAAEINADSKKTVRDFIGEFDGLSGTGRRKKVLQESGISQLHLRDFDNDGIDNDAVSKLLIAMQENSRPIKPKRLGLIGKEHLTSLLVAQGVHPDGMTYRKVLGEDAGMPFVVEVAFGVKETEGRELTVGFNNSIVFKTPSGLTDLISSDCRIDDTDPVVLVIHQTHPQIVFTDQGKGEVALSDGVKDSVKRALINVTKAFVRAKNRSRGGHLTKRDKQALRAQDTREKRDTLKQAAYKHMAEAYRLASSDGTLPANARQIMYQARPLILAELEGTGVEIWTNSSYFTQTLLPAYQEDNVAETADWDVVYDARGHFAEPHVIHRLGIGTLEVRNYISSWTDISDGLNLELDELYPTHGPDNRYKFALFIEKEGFTPLLKRSHIAERYDLAIFSSKGQSTTATRELVDELTKKGVTILVAHDFDISGFSIIHTLGHDNHRYQFQSEPTVVDLGLRLKDVKRMKLASEPWETKQNKDPRDNLRENGASEDEVNFLVKDTDYDSDLHTVWHGQRVELNAMTSKQFISWLEKKLKDHGVNKVIPAPDVLADAWQRANQIAQIQKAIHTHKTVKVPLLKNLKGRIQIIQNKNKALSWDAALVQLAKEEL